jgi:hypothetical protein
MPACRWRIEGHAVEIRLPFDGGLLGGTPSEHDFFLKRFKGVRGSRWIDAKLRM